MNMRKVLAFLLAAVMMLCFASCASDKVVDGGGETTPEPVFDPNMPEPKANASYTYNTYLSVFPTVWNNHTYQTATDAEIIGYTEPGFYTFDYNATVDGYKIVPEMAKEMPIDVTSEYVGQFGITAEDTARAWKIVLQDNIKWENGDPITAQSFVNSVKLLLNPVAGNYRADGLYTGNMIINNAKNYFYQGKSVDEDNSATGMYGLADLVKGEDGVYTTKNGEPVYIAIKTKLDWLNGNTLSAYVNAYGADYFDVDAFNALVAKADDKGYVAITDETLANIKSVITAVAAWGETEDDCVNYMVYTKTYADMDFDQVGVYAKSANELVIVLEKPCEGFYLYYSLTGNLNLVHEETYEANTRIEDGVYYNTYGTSAETYMSYGPYKLTDFQADKQIVLEKNEFWYGWGLESNKNCYWTTKIVYDYIEKPETAMEAFLMGKLDAKGLDVDQIKDYGNSEHVYYTDGASTFFIALNPDLNALKAEQEKAGENKNKTILTVKEFRMALSFALDRAAFNLACDPTGSAAFGVFNNLIISDPETGKAYRTTDAAKKVLASFWGLDNEIGEGKLYPTIDDALDSITGYNLAMGKDYFNKAYDKAIADGLMDADDVVEIKIGTPNSTYKFYSNGYEFLKNCYTEAVKGTKLENKLTFTIDNTLGNGFADALRANKVDMLFGVGWQGAALDPYYLMTAYTQDSYQYDPAWDTSSAQLEFVIDGKTYTASVWDWTLAMQGEKIVVTNVADKNDTLEFSCGVNDEKPALRLELLAALEGAVLGTYDLIPINNESSAALKGMQIKYYSEEYVYGVGRGGIKYMTYNYTDAEWAVYVAEQGGTLNYK